MVGSARGRLGMEWEWRQKGESTKDVWRRS